MFQCCEKYRHLAVIEDVPAYQRRSYLRSRRNTPAATRRREHFPLTIPGLWLIWFEADLEKGNSTDTESVRHSTDSIAQEPLKRSAAVPVRVLSPLKTYSLLTLLALESVWFLARFAGAI